ncbi:MAG: uroporphyrinogen decarboxylase family protein [Candidatus Hodarchaeales archaeon]
MESRQRILNAINHKELDRFPLDLGGPVSSIAKIAYDRYLHQYYPSDYPSTICNTIQQLACFSDSLLTQWEVDTRHFSLGYANKRDVDDLTFVDSFGITFKGIYSPEFQDILYFEMIDYPFKESRKIKDIEEILFPNPKGIKFNNLANELKTTQKNGLATIFDPPAGGVFEQTVYMVGMEGFIRDLILHYEFFEELISKVTYSFYIPHWEKVLEEVGDHIDIILMGEDSGMQDRMLISPSMWRKLVKPYLKKTVETIKKNSNAKVMIHSCGSIYPIIPDFIEIGVDILNPVQPLAKDINHNNLKKVFGDKICFHAGIDIQEVLPKGTPTDVKNEVNRVKRSLGADGTGYILSPAHNIQADVPPENIQIFLKSSIE